MTTLQHIVCHKSLICNMLCLWNVLLLSCCHWVVNIPNCLYHLSDTDISQCCYAFSKVNELCNKCVANGFSSVLMISFLQGRFCKWVSCSPLGLWRMLNYIKGQNALIFHKVRFRIAPCLGKTQLVRHKKADMASYWRTTVTSKRSKCATYDSRK